MTCADQVRRMLTRQGDYFHDASVIACVTGLLRFQVAQALKELRRQRVLRIRRVCGLRVTNGRERHRSELVYSVGGVE